LVHPGQAAVTLEIVTCQNKHLKLLYIPVQRAERADSLTSIKTSRTTVKYATGGKEQHLITVFEFRNTACKWGRPVCTERSICPCANATRHSTGEVHTITRHKGQEGEGARGMAPLILKLSTRWEW
jgi:hypothetical protein